jgi:hypothetical protein
MWSNAKSQKQKDIGGKDVQKLLRTLRPTPSKNKRPHESSAANSQSEEPSNPTKHYSHDKNTALTADGGAKVRPAPRDNDEKNLRKPENPHNLPQLGYFSTLNQGTAASLFDYTPIDSDKSSADPLNSSRRKTVTRNLTEGIFTERIWVVSDDESDLAEGKNTLHKEVRLSTFIASLGASLEGQ